MIRSSCLFVPLAILLPLLLSAVSAYADSQAADRVKPKATLRSQPFPLTEVRLLDGPFRHAQELDRRYLHSLDPDRLLVNFRTNAGLPATAKPYGGWEKPDSEVRGHFTGHYLSACARMYAATGDAELKRRAVYMAAEMGKCQAKMGTGYLSAFPTEFIDRVEAQQRVWAPWYTLHKILAGLLDVYRYCNDREALEVATKFCDWIKTRTDRLSDEQMEKMLGNEHGGMNDVLADIYAATGKEAYLKLALRFNHHAVLDPLIKQEDRLTGLHANTQIPKLIGAAREYEYTGDPALERAARFFWETVVHERSYVIGGHSDREAFSPKERLSHYLSADTTETCNTYNMLKLTSHLFTWEPKAEYADYYERALINHILASQNPKTGMMCYYVPLKSGAAKVYNTPEDSFWCCTGTGVENHARYGDAIYYHDGASTLYVNLFIASELAWRERGITLRQETQFPNEGGTRLTFSCKKPARLRLRVRHPGWARAGFGVTVNGKPVVNAGSPGGYVEIGRTWKSGDVVAMTLPMELRTEAFRDDPRRLAFLCGPIVLAASLKAGTTVPAIVSDTIPSPSAFLQPHGDLSLGYTCNTRLLRSESGDTPTSLNLFPFYAAHDRPTMVYWDVLSAEQWQQREEARRAEEERRKALDSRTIDVVRPGDAALERRHNLAGERMGDGPFSDRHWRHATGGGWFSWEMKVDPAVSLDLLCVYWGSDVGREFDVLVDGKKIATQRLQNNRPDRFFEVTYKIPADVVQGKEKVSVRFQARAGGIAGGVFECRIVKR